MEDNLALILSLVALVALSGFFSASETAYTSLNRVRVKNQANAGDRRAARVLALAERYDRLLAGILVGNNIVNILSASLATVLFTRWLGGAGVSASTAVMTVIVLMFGEIAPKSIANQRPEAVAFSLYPLLSAMLWLLAPIVFLTTRWQALVYKLFKPVDDRGITEDELITIVEEAENDGEIDEHESELIRSAIEFNDLTAADILTPRVDMAAVELDADAEEVSRAFAETGYSRLPVYEGDLDHIVGVVHEKDFYHRREGETLGKIMSPPLCVATSTQLAVLLKLLQKTRNHVAVVMDEYGGVAGMITMEDILEELVGEIWDEHDEIVEEIAALPDGSLRVAGSASLDDLREYLPVSEAYDSVTANGWVTEVLGRFPQPGDRFEFEGRSVEIERVGKRRVEQIRIYPPVENKTESA